MNEQEQIEKLSEMIDNSRYVGDTNKQIAEMALTMALHWNQDTQEAAPEMYAMLESIMRGDLRVYGYEYRIGNLLAKARGES